MRLSLLPWAGVLLAGMPLVFVQVLLAQLERGERLREEQRARVAVTAAMVVTRKPVKAAEVPQATQGMPTQHLVVSHYSDH